MVIFFVSKTHLCVKLAFRVYTSYCTREIQPKYCLPKRTLSYLTNLPISGLRLWTTNGPTRLSAILTSYPLGALSLGIRTRKWVVLMGGTRLCQILVAESLEFLTLILSNYTLLSSQPLCGTIMMIIIIIM